MNKSSKIQTAARSKLVIFFVFSILAILVLNQRLLGDQFILSVDLLFTPDNFVTEDLSLNTPIELVIQLLSGVFGGSLVQKLILIFSLASIGFATPGLLEKISRKPNYPLALTLGAVMMLNPFTFSRLIAGHWQLLVGISMLIKFMSITLDILESKQITNRSLYWIFGILLLTPFISAHIFWMQILVLMLLSIVSMIRIFRDRARKLDQNLLAIIAITTVGIGLIIWFSSGLDFSDTELISYSTIPLANFGILGNLLLWKGFWAEGLLFEPYFAIGMILIIYLFAVLGVVYLVDKKKYSHLGLLGSLGFIGLILAMGSSGILSDVFRFFYSDIPWLTGFREPQKLLILFVLANVILAGYGLSFVTQKVKLKGKYLISTIIIALVSISFLIPLQGYLAPVDYPTSYLQANNEFSNYRDVNGKTANVLILPWQTYISPNWAETRILDPSEKLFLANVISSQSSELTEYTCAQTDNPYLADDCIGDGGIAVWLRIIEDLEIDFVWVHKLDGYNWQVTYDLGTIFLQDETGLLLQTQ